VFLVRYRNTMAAPISAIGIPIQKRIGSRAVRRKPATTRAIPMTIE